MQNKKAEPHGSVEVRGLCRSCYNRFLYKLSTIVIEEQAAFEDRAIAAGRIKAAHEDPKPNPFDE